MERAVPSLAGTIIAAAALTSAVNFGPTPAAGPMPAAAAAPPPAGFLDYCARVRLDCGVDVDDADRALATAPRRWAERFSAARQPRLAPAAIRSSRDAAWSRRRMIRDAADAPPAAPPYAAPLTGELWTHARQINARVNRVIARRDDWSTYGVEDRWATPLANGESAGDCEDYALEKRRARREILRPGAGP